MEYNVYLENSWDDLRISEWYLSADNLDFWIVDAYYFIVDNIHFISK